MTEEEDRDENIMDWRVTEQARHDESYGYSDGRRIIRFVNQTLFSGDFPISLIQVEDTSWWIVNDMKSHEGMFEHVGPFDKFDDALIHFRLMGET